MSNTLKRYSSTAALLAPFMFFAGAALPAQAQETSAEAPAQLGDVIVTAQRREERLSTVPVSVTAFQGEELERLQINNIHDLVNNAPAVTNTATPYSKNDLLLAMRGVAPSGVLANVDPAVGVYMDGVYYARSQGSNFALVDIASAEVLRGPQGTLFGRNTIGGALNITTNKPTDEFEGSVSIGTGNYDLFTTTGIVSGPIVAGKLNGRAVFSHVSHDGYGQATNLSTPLSDQNSTYFRGALDWTIAENITATLSGDYYTGKEHGALWVVNYLDPTIASAGTQAAFGPYFTRNEKWDQPVDYNPERETEVYDLTATIVADFDWATLKSITAYRDVDFAGATDSDGTPNRILNYDLQLKGNQFTQEFQLSGVTLNDRLTWQAGVYYFTEENSNSIDAYQATAVAHNDMEPDNTSKSIYAQASYEFLPQWRVTAGARYVQDEREISYPAFNESLTGTPLSAAAACSLIPLGLNQVPGGCRYTPASVDFEYAPWTLGIDYRPTDNSLVYAKVSQGFRSGGFQQPGRTSVAAYAPFEPEDVVSEEIGAKFSLLDRRVTIDASAYHTDYNEIQQNIVQVVAGAPVIGVFNAGTAEFWGGELAVEALVGKLRLGASVGYIDPTFTEGPYKGTVVPTVAEETYAVRADYPVALQSGVIDLHVDYDYRTEVAFANTRNAANGLSYTAAQIASVTQDAYGLLNARVSYSPNAADLTFSIWGKNLTDEYYATRAGQTFAAGWNTTPVGDPLTFGASVTYRFGS